MSALGETNRGVSYTGRPTRLVARQRASRTLECNEKLQGRWSCQRVVSAERRQVGNVLEGKMKYAESTEQLMMLVQKGVECLVVQESVLK